jgi:hypothetical protein
VLKNPPAVHILRVAHNKSTRKGYCHAVDIKRDGRRAAVEGRAKGHHV